jgi:hypothetical protein
VTINGHTFLDSAMDNEDGARRPFIISPLNT